MGWEKWETNMSPGPDFSAPIEIILAIIEFLGANSSMSGLVRLGLSASSSSAVLRDMSFKTSTTTALLNILSGGLSLT